MGKTWCIDPPKKGFDTYFICSDVHTDHIHLPTFKIMLEMSKKYKSKPNLIINGDLLDVDWLFKKNEQYLDYRKRANGIEDFFIPNVEKNLNGVIGSLETKKDTLVHEATHFFLELTGLSQKLTENENEIYCQLITALFHDLSKS